MGSDDRVYVTDGRMPCIATPKRVRWALLRTGWSSAQRDRWADMHDPMTMEAARVLARHAQVNLAALFLPDPGPWTLFRSWFLGRLRS
jgi:hypothetical protein